MLTIKVQVLTGRAAPAAPDSAAVSLFSPARDGHIFVSVPLNNAPWSSVSAADEQISLQKLWKKEIRVRNISEHRHVIVLFRLMVFVEMDSFKDGDFESEIISGNCEGVCRKPEMFVFDFR